MRKNNSSRWVRQVKIWVLLSAATILPATGQMTTPAQFQVNESGAATYTIPIQVSPSIGGMAPDLSITYNSQSGNGLLGVGWALSGLGAVGRCARTNAQDGVVGGVNYDSNDRYCLDGQRLIAIAGTYGADGTEYRTERESFTKVISYSSAGNGPAWFKVWTKAGQMMEYGHTTDSRIEAQGKSTIRVWALNRIEDSKGNYITTNYTKNATNGDYYPSRIDYTGNSKTSQAPSNSVQFQYEPRSDVIPMYLAGSLQKRDQQLKSIQVYRGTVGIKEYKFTYVSSPTSFRSRLSSLVECQMSGVNCQPPVVLTYGTGVNEGNRSWTDASQFTPPYFLTIDGLGPAGQFIDLNGDGLPDFVWNRFSNGTVVQGAYLNTGNGWVSAPQFIPPYFLTIDGADTAGKFVDLNGDGLPDFVWNRFSNGTVVQGAYLNTGNGWVNAPQFVPPYFLTIDSVGAAGQFIDLNGDGLPDFVWNRFGWNGAVDQGAYLNTGNGWVNAPQFVPPYFLTIDNVGAAGQFIDLNGDGRADFVWNRFSNGTIVQGSYLNAGGGWSSAPQFTPSYFLTIDGVGFSGQFADLNGDGFPDFIWRRFSNGIVDGGSSLAPLQTDRLNSISNGLSATINIGYLPLTNGAVYKVDSASAYPIINVQTPMYVVSSVTSPNGIGGTTNTQYTYGGLKADQSGRGLLGFRWQQAKQVESGLTSYSEFRQDWPYTGLQNLAKKTLAGGGNNGVLSQVTSSYGCSDPSNVTITPCTMGIGKRYFVYANQSISSNWDLSGAAFPVTTTNTTYDNWGNATAVNVSTSDGFSKSTINSFSNDSTNWLLGRLLRASVTSVSP